MRLHRFTWERLSTDFLHQVVFHNQPGMRPVLLHPRHRRFSMRMLHRISRFLLSPFLWTSNQIVLAVDREWVLEMRLDPEEPRSPERLVFIAEVARFAAGELQCGRWAYSPPGIWRCLDSYFAPFDQEILDQYQQYYYLQSGERVKLACPPGPPMTATDASDTAP